MKKSILLVAVLALALGALVWQFTGPATAGRALPNCPGTVFAKEAMVFDVLAICATSDVPDAAFDHAANVAAEWLDNDGDGALDEPRLVAAMQSQRPFLIMTPNGPGFRLFQSLGSELGDRIGQDLAARETNPSNGDRDASQEEIHHVIHNSGWRVAFPDLFADAPGSALYGQWELAEQQGNYKYDDPTCDANCKVVEFFYLATAAYLGSEADLQSDEMRLKDRAALASALPETVNLMVSPDYNYPLDHWPTGTYAHRANIVIAP